MSGRQLAVAMAGFATKSERDSRMLKAAILVKKDGSHGPDLCLSGEARHCVEPRVVAGHAVVI
jgi:hypothetical protein